MLPKFFSAILGHRGADVMETLSKASKEMCDFIPPRVIVGWLNSSKYGEVRIPLDCPLSRLTKSGYGYSGEALIKETKYFFKHVPEEFVAAIISVATDIPTETVTKTRDVDLAKLAKTIDLLIKAQKQYEYNKEAGYVENEQPKSPELTQPAQNQTKSNVPKPKIPKIKVPKAPESPLNKMALIHDNPAKPITVYRVQNESGEGPYKAWHPTNQVDVSKILMMLPEKNTPYPTEDFSYQERKEMEQNGANRYGFRTPQDAADWFGEQGLSKLKDYGYKLVPIKASRAYAGRTNKQVVFTPHESEKKLHVAKSDWPISEPHKPVKLTRNESTKSCSVCGQKMFLQDSFVGCTCFRPLAKNTSVSVTGDSLTVKFGEEWDKEAVLTFLGVFKNGR